MIKIENTDIYGWEAAIRGMRNSYNSWDKSDSILYELGYLGCDDCPKRFEDCSKLISTNKGCLEIGENDLKLMRNLAKAGDDHGKFLRMINVTCDITAPLYWWKEYDTYKVGTVANSCSTMHKIHANEFTLDDFSHEHLGFDGMTHLEETIGVLNFYRDKFNDGSEWNGMSKKDFWWQMIQLLPTSYNQKRTVQLNYQVLKNMYNARKLHKLDEWREFCEWYRRLPYFIEIMDIGMVTMQEQEIVNQNF